MSTDHNSCTIEISDDELDLFDIINASDEKNAKNDLKNSNSSSKPLSVDYSVLDRDKISISSALSQKYSNNDIIDIDLSEYSESPKINFKQHLAQPKPPPKEYLNIINNMNKPPQKSISKDVNSIKFLDKYREKMIQERKLPFSTNPSLKIKHDFKKGENDALESLKRWRDNNIEPEKSFPTKRNHSEESIIEAKILKKPKDIKAGNIEFLKQNNHEIFSLEAFMKEQQRKDQEKAKLHQEELARLLETKNKNEKEYRDKMRNKEFVPATITKEEELHIQKNLRQNNRHTLCEFYSFLLKMNVYDIKLVDDMPMIPNIFEHGGEYIQYFMPAFFEEAKAEIISALNQNDMTDFSVVKFYIHSISKEDNLILLAREEAGGKFKFFNRAQPEDILLIIPYELYLNCNLPSYFKNWKETPTAIIGLTQRDNSGSQLRILADKSYAGLFENELTCAVFVLDSSTTMLREFKMIKNAEFLNVSEQILNPKCDLIQCKSEKLKNFINAIEKYHNESQIDAIAKICDIEKGIFLLQGPPGTGKTHTIQGILSAIIQKENNKPFVLVCAPSNSAVDEIANRVALDGLYDIDGSQKIYTSILRIGNKFTKNFQDIREKLKKDLRESPPAVKEIMLSTKVAALLKNEGTENGNIEIDKLLKDLENIDKSLLAARQKKKPNSLIISLEEKRTQTSNALFRTKQANKSATKKRKECEIALLNTSNIIFTTLSSAGSKEVLQISHDFEYIIIDEACQAVELSSLIPLFFRAKIVILVGDPMQLPSTTLNYLSNKNLYARSLFERLMDGGSKVYMLTIQYRMIPEISYFPSLYFYNNKLENADSVHTNPIPSWITNRGILFINLTTSSESRNSIETSISNTNEAEFIGKLYTFLKPLHGTGLNIGIISPYKKQVTIIKDYLTNFYENDWKNDIEVNTIDGFQGREKDVIIFSAVRTGNTIGFLADVRRMNVAITRAKYGLWIVAKMDCLNQNKNWEEFILHCKNCNKIVNCNDFKEISEKFIPGSPTDSAINKIPKKVQTYSKRDTKQEKIIKMEEEKKYEKNKKNKAPAENLVLDIINRKH